MVSSAQLAVVVVASLLPATVSAACVTATNPTGNMATGCCLQTGGSLLAEVWVDTGKRYDHKLDMVYDGGSVGVDNPTCGAAGSPCQSIKYATYNRVTANGVVKLVAGGYYAGADNRNIQAPTSGATAGGQACTRVGPYSFEGASSSNRPMVDMEFQHRFLTLGNAADLSGNWYGDYGQLAITNVAFMRGSAPYESHNEAQWGSANLAGFKAFCHSSAMDPEFVCPCNMSNTNASTPNSFDPTTFKCNQVTPASGAALGVGGVLQLWGGYYAPFSVTTLHNCDFGKSQALIAGAIGLIGGTLKITGDPVLLQAGDSLVTRNLGTVGEQGAIDHPIGSGNYIQNEYTKASEPWRASYCNFNQNAAWGGASDSGAGGAIYLMPLPGFGLGADPKVIIEGCNFWRNYAFNPVTNQFTNGGAIGGNWVGYVNLYFDTGITAVSKPLFNFTKVTFYENVAAYGSGFWMAPNRGQSGAYPGAAAASNVALWKTTGYEFYLTDVYAARQGYYDGVAMAGVTIDNREYGAFEFKNFNSPSGPNVYYHCQPAPNITVGATCYYDSDGYYGPTPGVVTTGEAQCYANKSHINGGGLQEITCKCGVQSQSKLACSSGMTGVFQTNTNPSLRWNFPGLPLDWPEAKYNGAQKLMPHEEYACQGFDQYGDATYAPGSVYNAAQKAMTGDDQFFANCGSMGVHTFSKKHYNPGSGSTMTGLVGIHGGFAQFRGATGVTFIVKDSKFVQNGAAGDAGAFNIIDREQYFTGKVLFQNTQFVRNRGRTGGAIKSTVMSVPAAVPTQYVDAPQPDSKLELLDCKFIANVAKWSGGAVATWLPLWITSWVPQSVATSVSLMPPACQGNYDAPATRCNPEPMGTWGAVTWPQGTKIIVEVKSSTPVSNASQLSASSSSAYIYNYCAKRGGVFNLENSASVGRPSMNSSFVLNVSDSYIAHNGARLEGLNTAANKDNTFDRSGEGGVVSIYPTFSKTSVKCQIYPECSSASTTQLGCPMTYNGAGVGGNYDACLYQNYYWDPQGAAAVASLAGLQKVAYNTLEHEDTPLITFTRCRMHANVARRSGGLVVAFQVYRDAANITFAQSLLTDNVAFYLGGLVYSTTGPNSQNTFPQKDAIAEGRNIWVGEVKFVDTTVRGSSSGFSAGALMFDNDGRAVLENSHFYDSIATFHNNVTHWRSKLNSCVGGLWSQAGVQSNTWSKGATWVCPAVGGVTYPDEYGYLVEMQTTAASTWTSGQSCTMGGWMNQGTAYMHGFTTLITDSTISGSVACMGGLVYSAANPLTKATCSTNETACAGTYPVGGYGQPVTKDIGIVRAGCSNLATNKNCRGEYNVNGLKVVATSTILSYIQNSVFQDSLSTPQVYGDLATSAGFFSQSSISVVVTGSTFQRAYTPGTAGVFSLGTTSPGQIVAHTTTFKENNCDYYGCVAEMSNAGLFLCYNCTFKGNMAKNGLGGALTKQWDSANFTAIGGVIEETYSAKHSAGFFLSADSTVTLSGVQVKNNVAAWYAGLFFAAYNSRIFITDCTFSNNRVLGYDGRGGGVMMLMDKTRAEITNTQFLNNYAYHDGGAIQVRGAPVLSVKNSSFTGNTAGEDGGAIFVEHDKGSYWGGSYTIVPCQNQSASGANYQEFCEEVPPRADLSNLPIFPLAGIAISNTTFTGNKAGEYGGAFASGNVFSYLYNCAGEGNNAKLGGGFGAILHANGSLWMEGQPSGTVLQDNTADQAGGAFYSRAIQEGDPARLVTYSSDRPAQSALGNSTRSCAPLGLAGECPGGILRLKNMKMVRNSATYWGGAFAYDRVPFTPQISASTVQSSFAGVGSVATFMYNKTSDLAAALNLTGTNQTALIAAAHARTFQVSSPMSGEPLVRDNRVLWHEDSATHPNGLGEGVLGYNTQWDPVADGTARGSYSTLPAQMSLTAPGLTRKSVGFVPGLPYDNVYASHGEDVDALKFVVQDGFGQKMYIANNTFCLLRADVKPMTANLYGHKAPCALTSEAAFNMPDCIRAPTLAGVLDSTATFGGNQYKAIEFRSYFDSALELRVDCAHRWPLNAIPEDMKDWGDISFAPVQAYNSILARDCPKGWYPVGAATQALYSQKLYVQMCSPCPAGTFSPALNAACQTCPAGASSNKASVGIQSCFCPTGEFVKVWEYIGMDPTLSGMGCTECKNTCSKGPLFGGGFAGSKCNQCIPWTSVGPNRFPMARSKAWAGKCSSGGDCYPRTVNEWGSNTKIYKCPYKKSCPGDYNKNAWSVEYKSWGDVRRSNPPDQAPPMCSSDEAHRTEDCCPAPLGQEVSAASVLAGKTTGMESGNTCYWGTPVGPVCGKGYKGAVCAVCADGYSFSGRSCNKCDGFELNSMFLSFLLIIAFLMYELLGKIAHMRTKKQAGQSQSLSMLMKRKKILARTKACTAQVMVIVSFAQVLCTLGDTTNVEFPSAFDELSDSMMFLNFDVINVMSSLCYWKANYYDTLLLQFLWPTLLILLLVLDHVRERRTSPEDEYAGVNQIKAIVMVLFTAFPLSVLIYLKFFLCREIDGEYYMQADYRYQCYDDKWNGHLAIVLPGIIMYLVGTPAFFVGVLWYHDRRGSLAHPVNEDKYAFLFAKFKQEYWFMESYSLMVKLCLVGIIMFILKGSATQVTVSLCFALCFLILSMNTSPFKNNDMNAGEMITRLATMVTLFCALLIRTDIAGLDGWDEGLLNGILMFVNLGVMIVFLYRFFRVQGLFLCETYMPEVCAEKCLECFIWCGWREDPNVAAKLGDVELEEVGLLGVVSLQKPATYEEQTFKCVS